MTALKSLNIYNVKHGDFGVYHDSVNNYQCIFDCGSTQLNSSLHTAACLTPGRIIDRVTHCMFHHPSLKRDVLISHYHEDHFNGLGILKAKQNGTFFNTMYLPFIDFKQKYTGQLLYSLCLLQGAADALNIEYTLRENFSSLFSEKYAQEKKYLRRGEKIKEIKDNIHNVAEILWPPKGIDGESKELQRFIEKLKDSLSKHDLESAISKTKEYCSELKSNISSQEIHIVDSEDSDNTIKPIDKVDINELFGIEDVKRKKRRGTHDQQEVIDAFNELKSAVKGFLNALSIVFKVGDTLLWMGDIKEEVLKILIKYGNFKNDIEYFKLPHHGTIDISAVQIKASMFIASLAYGKNYKPLHKNNITKALKDGTFISCTDGHRHCHKGFPVSYPLNCLPILCQNTYCSQNTRIRITL